MLATLCQTENLSEPEVSYPSGWQTAKQALKPGTQRAGVEFCETFTYYVHEIISVHQETPLRWSVMLSVPKYWFARSEKKGGPIIGPLAISKQPTEYEGSDEHGLRLKMVLSPLKMAQDGRLFCTLESVAEAVGTPKKAIIRVQTMYLESPISSK